jgi:hypothetical protein
VRRTWAVTAVLLTISFSAIARDSRSIAEVTVSRPFFNPSIRQTVQVSLALLHPGRLTIDILDSRGNRVRRLAENERVSAGKTAREWNGRSDEQEVVPDDAYSLEVTLAAGGKTEKYSPGLVRVSEVSVSAPAYDPRSGIVSYRLASPARVYLTAGGRASEDSPARLVRILVDREPRVAGAIVESWNGLDEKGKLYLPELREFALQASAQGLPENAIITIGNRSARSEEKNRTAAAP